MKTEIVSPPKLGRPIGYSHGIRAGGLLFIAGQIGAIPRAEGGHDVVSPELAPQFEKALENVMEVVRAAGGTPENVVEMVLYVKSVADYRASRKTLREAWKRVMGTHYPAMTLVEITGLFEEKALVEIRAIAAVG